MNGDPFRGLVERGKLAFDGVRQYYERLFAEENQPLVTITAEPQVRVKANDDCPNCHGPRTIREVCQNTFRCADCGWQPRVVGPAGISKKQLDTFQYPSAEHQQKFQRGFNEALWRIRGPHR